MNKDTDIRKLMAATVAAFVISVSWPASAPEAAAPLKVSDYGDLQTAIDAAKEGDTILVDIDTPGAILEKRLTIRGVPGVGTGGVITAGDPLPTAQAAVAIRAGGSGSDLINLRIDGGFFGIRNFPDLSDPAVDVVVRGCTIRAGVAGLLPVGVSGWIIEHNSRPGSEGLQC